MASRGRRRDAIDATPPAAQDFGDGEKNPNLITPEKYAELVRRPSPFRRHRRDVYSIYAG